MGSMFYGLAAEPIQFPDRLLAHIQVVVSTKLRRSESFTIGWEHSADDPAGRSTIWVHESMPLRFNFDVPDPGTLNRELLQRLADEANTSAGLMITRALIGEFDQG